MSLPRPNAADYVQHLEAVRCLLTSSAERADIRGDGLARFIWAEAAGRSVEVYWDEAGVCVEFWERDAGFESHQQLHPSYELAVEAALAWLVS